MCNVGFISKSWHIKSKGMFAGTCIGVVLLVMSLEFLRRLAKEYDRYLFRQYKRSQQRASVIQSRVTGKDGPSNGSSTTVTTTAPSSSRPNIFQQAVRATLHMMQFAVAYFIMMLVMYYNGYFIICIIAGAWLGAFVFSWESVSLVRYGTDIEKFGLC
jgi:copper transporter 1